MVQGYFTLQHLSSPLSKLVICLCFKRVELEFMLRKIFMMPVKNINFQE